MYNWQLAVFMSHFCKKMLTRTNFHYKNNIAISLLHELITLHWRVVSISDYYYYYYYTVYYYYYCYYY